MESYRDILLLWRVKGIFYCCGELQGYSIDVGNYRDILSLLKITGDILSLCRVQIFIFIAGTGLFPPIIAGTGLFPPISVFNEGHRRGGGYQCTLIHQVLIVNVKNVKRNAPQVLTYS